MMPDALMDAIARAAVQAPGAPSHLGRPLADLQLPQLLAHFLIAADSRS